MRFTQLQTPQKDQSSATRRLKSTPDPKRNLRKVSICVNCLCIFTIVHNHTNSILFYCKVVKKSLNPDFASVLEEDGADLESSELISGDNLCSESTEVVSELIFHVVVVVLFSPIEFASRICY